MGLVHQLSVVAGLLIVAALLISFDPVVGPPVHPNSVESDGQGANNTEWNLGLPYEKYLQEVIRVLEEDGEFKAKLELAKSEDITSGRISEQLQFVNHRVRNQLDELKRIELTRLRKILKEQAELYNSDARANSKGRFRDGTLRGQTGLDLPDHVDVSNPHTFEIEDLKKLVMQTTRDLEEVDRRRREEFKSYELDKEYRRRESLQVLDDDKRKLAEQEFEEQQKKHKEHPKLHHPGSKQQLEQVWEEADEMPVEEFEPRTFHSIHDVNGDGFWDYEELSALFIKELNKMYDSKNPEDDMQERNEEMNRMREHVMNETDVNQDGMISLQEFMEMTKRRDFDEDPGWQGIDEEQQFNENEFQEYEKRRMGPHGGAGGVPPGGYMQNEIHPNAEYQHLPPPGHHQQQQQFQQQQFQEMQYQQFQQQPPHMRQQQPNHGYPVQPPQQFQGGQPNYQLPQGYQQLPPQQQGFQQGYQQQGGGGGGGGGYQHQQPHSYEQPQKLGHQQQMNQQPQAPAAHQVIPSVVQQQAQAVPVVGQQLPLPATAGDQKQALPSELKTQPGDAAAPQAPKPVQQQAPVVKDAGQQHSP